MSKFKKIFNDSKFIEKLHQLKLNLYVKNIIRISKRYRTDNSFKTEINNLHDYSTRKAEDIFDFINKKGYLKG